MSHKITVGLQQKVGRPNYGSLGATCHIELTLSEEEARHTDTITSRIREAFASCRDRVAEQLSADSSQPPPDHRLPIARTEPAVPGNGRLRPASEAQIRALHAIAAKHGVVLASELEAQFGVRTPSELTIRQASELIDALKTTTAS